MAGSERDSTQDWLLPEAATPPLLSELERRIDHAVATAQASEAAVVVVGAAAIDAAEDAHRAAALAEQAANAAFEAGRGLNGAAASLGRDDPSGDESLRSFTERADRIVLRLRQLERRPMPALGASAKE